MCGVAGFISKDPSLDIGNKFTDMLKELIHRGQDATGMAFYEKRNDIQVRVSMTDLALDKDLEKIIGKYGAVSNVRSYNGVGRFSFYEASVGMKPEQVTDLNWEIDSDARFCVHSVGEQIKVFKDQGSAQILEDCHKISTSGATHGIGHVRLATESVEDINFAHPFSSYINPELTIVHNGQLTNYFNMRRKMEYWGIRFKTNNDSEIPAHLISYLMKEKNMDLEEALHESLEQLDGLFSILVATSTQVGAFKDRLGIKPILFHEGSDGTVLFGSEQICLTPVAPDLYASEMEPGEVKIWSV